MAAPAKEYSRILQKAGLQENVPEKPQLYLSASDSWTEITIRYLVAARERRKWKTQMLLEITEELNKPEYKTMIIPVYPRQQVQIIDANGRAVES